MIIDIIVIFKLYLIVLSYLIFSIDNGGVCIRYPYPNTDTLCYNTDSVRRTPYIPLDNLYIIDEPIR